VQSRIHFVVFIHFQEFSEKILGILSNKETETIDKQPSILSKSMKTYQIEGLQWLYTLHKADVNGILADEVFSSIYRSNVLDGVG
jgi:SNF2 family DNA or RNA helicase